MNLVIDDQSPGTRMKKVEVGKIGCFAFSPRQHLISGQGDRADGFSFSGVFRNHFFGDIGLVQ